MNHISLNLTRAAVVAQHIKRIPACVVAAKLIFKNKHNAHSMNEQITIQENNVKL